MDVLSVRRSWSQLVRYHASVTSIGIPSQSWNSTVLRHICNPLNFSELISQRTTNSFQLVLQLFFITWKQHIRIGYWHWQTTGEVRGKSQAISDNSVADKEKNFSCNQSLPWLQINSEDASLQSAFNRKSRPLFSIVQLLSMFLILHDVRKVSEMFKWYSSHLQISQLYLPECIQSHSNLLI